MRVLAFLGAFLVVLAAAPTVRGQDADVVYRFEGAGIAAFGELGQFATDSQDASGGGTTVDQRTLRDYAEQIFVGSVWLLYDDGYATFEYGQEYDLEDFSIGEERAVLEGTWEEKRNGELAVAFEANDLSADATVLVTITLEGDIVPDGEAATIELTYFQGVSVATLTTAVSDFYTYALTLDLAQDGADENEEDGPPTGKHAAEAER